MKAKFVYENMRFERGGDPKSAMGIGKRTLIKKWFDDLNIDPNEYTIDNDFNIFLKGYLDLVDIPITFLPDNLKVGGSLNLANSQITSLPDNLSVGGSLNLYSNPITFLPDNLSVRRDLYLMDTKITSLPDNLSVGGKIYKDF